MCSCAATSLIPPFACSISDFCQSPLTDLSVRYASWFLSGSLVCSCDHLRATGEVKSGFTGSPHIARTVIPYTEYVRGPVCVWTFYTVVWMFQLQRLPRVAPVTVQPLCTRYHTCIRPDATGSFLTKIPPVSSRYTEKETRQTIFTPYWVILTIGQITEQQFNIVNMCIVIWDAE